MDINVLSRCAELARSLKNEPAQKDVGLRSAGHDSPARTTAAGKRFPGNYVWCTTVFAWWWVRYVAYRLKLGQRPELRPIWREGLTFLGPLFGCPRRLRVAGAEHCPKEGPAVFVANHVFTFDPFYTLYAIWVGSGCRIMTHSMMRDDFFAKYRTFLVDPDEVLYIVGARMISRGKVQLGQLKPFVEFLKRAESFFMYPGGTRTRSGLLMELGPGQEEPGSPSFFIAQAQRKGVLRPPVAVPMARTHNPATGWNTVAFGQPRTLPEGSSREEQRAFDFALAEEIGRLIEINICHVLFALLYLRCLHHLPGKITRARLLEYVEQIVAGLDGYLVEPETRDHTGEALSKALAYLAKREMVTLHAGAVTVLCEAVLACPAPGHSYRKQNPLKFFVNQVMHLRDFVALVEEVCLSSAAPPGA